MREQQTKIERLQMEWDEAQEAARWWRQAASGHSLDQEDMHPDERWPWLLEHKDN
jgi:hypothetical protein